MTISSETNSITYAGNGVTVAFAFPYLFYGNADLLVLSVAADGTVTTLVLNVGYTVDGAGVSIGGTVTTTVAPASGTTLTITRSPAAIQASHYVSTQPFPSATVERGYDYLTMLCQRLLQRVKAAIHYPDGETNIDATLAPVSTRKGTYLFFDAITGAISYAVNLAVQTLTQTVFNAFYILTDDHKRTAAEIAAAVIPTAYQYLPFNVRRYGAALDAVWNGSLATGTDDTVAFTNAIRVASAAGGGEVTFDGPTIIKNVPVLSYVTIRGIGQAIAYVNPTAVGDTHFNAQGIPGTAVAVTNSIVVGGLTANVANTSTFSVGQYVVLQTTGTAVPNDYVFYGGAATYPTSNGRKQQILRVESIVANVSLTFDTGVFEPYTGGSVQVCPLNAITYNNAVGAVIGFNFYSFSARVAIGVNGGGVQIWYGVDFKIRDLTITGASGYPGIRTIQSAYGDIAFNRITDCQQVGAGLSTGIAHDIIESSHYIEVHHNKLSYLTEDEISGRCWHCQFHHNHYLDAFDSGINTHGSSNFHIDITDNVIICPNATAGIAIGYSIQRTSDSYINVSRNRIVNSGGKGISIVSQGYTLTAITQAASAVATINTVSASNPLTVGDVLTFTGVNGMVQINGLAGTVTAIGGVSGAWTATVNINSTAFTAYTSAGSVARPNKYCKIVDNTIIGWKLNSALSCAGILAQFCDDLEIRGNTLDGATIVSAVDAGITVQNSTRPQVMQNRVKNGTGAYGIQFINDAGWEAAFNTLINNANQCDTLNSSGTCLLHDNISDTTTNSIENTTPPRVRSYGNTWDGYGATNRVTVTYTSGVAMTFDASLGHRFELTITDGVAWTINAPTNPPALAFGSRRITLVVRNTSGGALGASTFNAAFKMAAFTAPATTFSRSIEWEWNGANWVECFRSANDVPN